MVSRAFISTRYISMPKPPVSPGVVFHTEQPLAYCPHPRQRGGLASANVAGGLEPAWLSLPLPRPLMHPSRWQAEPGSVLRRGLPGHWESSPQTLGAGLGCLLPWWWDGPLFCPHPRHLTRVPVWKESAWMPLPGRWNRPVGDSAQQTLIRDLQTFVFWKWVTLFSIWPVVWLSNTQLANRL